MIGSLIDDGKNPDEFTRDVLKKCIAKNQITKGKADALKVIVMFLALVMYVIFVYLALLFIRECIMYFAMILVS